MISERIVKLHNEILYPTVRVTTKDSGGSGTVVYSKPDSTGKVVTMVMTNHHVVETCIEVKKSWDSKIGQERKREFKETVHVEFFKYNNHSRVVGSFAVEADIVAYDAEQDMALLQLRDKERVVDDVAIIFQPSNLDEVQICDTVYAVGAAIGHAPLQTLGEITHMDDEIEHYKYWMTSANTIYGSSGGAIYRHSESRDRWEYIAIPSRIEVIMSGFGTAPITHLGYAVPIERIVGFMEANCYQFIYDESTTPDECKELRTEMRKKADDALISRLGGVTHE